MTQYAPEDFIPFAEQLATLSGEIVRRYFRQGMVPDQKADDSPVTIADKEVERNVRAAIGAQFPEHGIIGEELEPVNEDADYVWVIDPIDGTKSFMIGRPLFGTLITLLYKNEPILGIIDQPIIGERWTGVKGFATNFNYEPCKSRACKKLSDAVLATTSPNLFKGADRDVFENFREQAKYVVYGGDCYNYGLLAMGLVDVILESDLKPYDFLALVPILAGTGAIISDWEGKPLSNTSDGRVLACGDKALHRALVKEMQS